MILLLNIKTKERECIWSCGTYGFGNINHRCLVLLVDGSIFCLFRDKCPELLGVDRWAELAVSLHVEDTHTTLTVETWVAKSNEDTLFTYNLFIIILSWCIPPALPLPLGCFLCFPILPWPMDTCPLNFLTFFRPAVYTKLKSLWSYLPFLKE